MSSGQTPAAMHAKSPLRYRKMQLNLVAVTTTASANHVGVCEAPGVIKEILLTQQIAGDGTSWTVDIKKNGTTVLATAGIMLASAGANKTVNLLASPLGVITLATGCTRPILSATASVLAVAQGDVITADITIAGTYTTGVTGSISVLSEPAF